MDAVGSNAKTRIISRVRVCVYIYIQGDEREFRGGGRRSLRVGEPFRAYGTSPRVSKELGSIAPSH